MIKFLVMDVDGTLTDGKIYIGQDGEAMQAFSVKDGCGILLAQNHNIIPVIITARESQILENRCKELGITELHQGSKDKLQTLQGILSAYSNINTVQNKQTGQNRQDGQINHTESCGDGAETGGTSEGSENASTLKDVAYIGDDLHDLAVMKAVKEAGGVVLAPADAIEEIKVMADYISPYRAGDGAVRDCIDNYLLRSTEGEQRQNQQRQYHQHNSESSATSATSEDIENNETPYPSAPLLLACVKDEYEKERNRMQNLDTKASAFMTAIILILTLFVPMIPFDKFRSVFTDNVVKAVRAANTVNEVTQMGVDAVSAAVSGQIETCIDIRRGILAISTFVLLVALGMLSRAFHQLYTAYRPMNFARFEIENIDFVAQPLNIMTPALCEHYKEIVENNIEVNDRKVKRINSGLKWAFWGFFVLAVVSIVIKICVGG